MSKDSQFWRIFLFRNPSPLNQCCFRPYCFRVFVGNINKSVIVGNKYITASMGSNATQLKKYISQMITRKHKNCESLSYSLPGAYEFFCP